MKLIKSIDGQDPKDYFNNLIENIHNNQKNNKSMENRESIFKKINDELDYIKNTEKSNPTVFDASIGERQISEYLNYIEYHLQIAQNNVRNKNNIYDAKNQSTLAEIRKFAALAIKCLGAYGCPERILKND